MWFRARWPERNRQAGSARHTVGQVPRVIMALLFGGCAISPQAIADDPATTAESNPDACDHIVVERVLRQCQACHELEKGRGHSTGPNLFGVYGRKAGKIAGFSFSAGLKTATFRWDSQHLDAFLEDPQKLIPGTRMAFGGLSSSADRQALICHFKRQVHNDAAANRGRS